MAIDALEAALAGLDCCQRILGGHTAEAEALALGLWLDDGVADVLAAVMGCALGVAIPIPPVFATVVGTLMAEFSEMSPADGASDEATSEAEASEVSEAISVAEATVFVSEESKMSVG